MQATTAVRADSRGRVYLLAANGLPLAINVGPSISGDSSTELLVEPCSPAQAQLQVDAQVIVGSKTSALLR